MSTAPPLILLALFMTLPFAIVAIAVSWQKQVAVRRNKVWARVAYSLGLSHTKDCIWGTLDGRNVQLRTELRGGKNKTMYTVLASSHHPPLDLGLGVTRQGTFADSLASLFGRQDVRVGDPVFDPACTVCADEPVRAAWLLTPALRQVLLSFVQSGSDFELNDHGFTMSRRGGIEHEAWLHWALRCTARTTHQVEQARGQVPAAYLLQPVEREWRAFAAQMGLAAMSTPLCMGGRLGGIEVSAYALRIGPLLYGIEVLVHYAEPIGVGLLVRPAESLDGLAAFFGGQDLNMGDPVFDGAFVVQASDPRRVHDILDREVRARALELHQRIGRVQIRDEGITLRSLSPARHPAEVPRLIEALKALAEKVHANARLGPAAKAGPYR